MSIAYSPRQPSLDDVWEEFPSREDLNDSWIKEPMDNDEKQQLTNDNKKNKTFLDFLKEVKLDKYLDIFIKEGYEDINDLKLITFPDLMAMNIPRGHSRRLLEKLEIINNNENNNNINKNSSNNSMLKSSIVNGTNDLVLSPGKLSKNANPLNINILLLGDADVGKTSLRKRMELDKFVETSCTTGVEMTPLFGTYQNNDLQCTVWDPAGQERYAPITKTFFRRAHGAAVIFSANEPLSWKSVEFWLNELDTNAPDDIEIILICNKYDTIFNDNNNNNKNNKENNDKCDKMIKKAIEIARNRRIPFFMTSAKSGKCVRQSFSELVSLILSNQMIVKKLFEEKKIQQIKNNKNNKIKNNNKLKRKKSDKVLGINNNKNTNDEKNLTFQQKWNLWKLKLKKDDTKIIPNNNNSTYNKNSHSSDSNSSKFSNTSWGVVDLSDQYDSKCNNNNNNNNGSKCSGCKTY